MGQRTPLYQCHVDAGAKIVDFAGWEMPINYGSQIEEHNSVRQAAGVFDVSHMTVVDVSGPEAKAYLQNLLANDVARLVPGKALYSAMLNHAGGVIDDLITYEMSWGYRVVVNCATREKDLAWMQQQVGEFSVAIHEQPSLAILAIHGPEAIEKVSAALDGEYDIEIEALKNFHGFETGPKPLSMFIARTGYTGEKGLEVILPEQDAADLWRKLLEEGVKPIGLGARDTLRLEAGMNLYGHDMDESISPLAANMENTIAFEPETRNFIGRTAVEGQRGEQAAGKIPILTGLVLEERGVLREGQKVVTDKGEGVITSGSFSPTLKHSIALARIPLHSENCQVDMRGKLVNVRRVKPNFVRFGKKVFD